MIHTQSSQNKTVVSQPLHSKLQPQANNITIDDISPELAAQIVKNFILPMFESDEKRYLRKKYQGLAGKITQGRKDVDTTVYHPH